MLGEFLRLSKPTREREADHVGPEFITTKGEQVPWTVSTQICELPLNWTGRQCGAATGVGDGADGETLGAARDGGLEALRQRRNDGEPGQWTGDDCWPNQVPGRRLRLCVTIFPLPLVHELGPRPQGGSQVRAWLRDKRREEDVNGLISSLNWYSGSIAPFASDSVPAPRQDLVTARIRELVDRSLPTFAIPGQRVAFMKLLRGRGVYDTRDGRLSLASFRSVSKISLHCGISPR